MEVSLVVHATSRKKKKRKWSEKDETHASIIQLREREKEEDKNVATEMLDLLLLLHNNNNNDTAKNKRNKDNNETPEERRTQSHLKRSQVQHRLQLRGERWDYPLIKKGCIWNDNSHLHNCSILFDYMRLFRDCLWALCPTHPASFNEDHLRFYFLNPVGIEEPPCPLSLAICVGLSSGNTTPTSTTTLYNTTPQHVTTLHHNHHKRTRRTKLISRK